MQPLRKGETEIFKKIKEIKDSLISYDTFHLHAMLRFTSFRTLTSLCKVFGSQVINPKLCGSPLAALNDLVDVSLLRNDLLCMKSSFSGLVASNYSSRAVNTLCSSEHVRMFNGQLFAINRTALRAETEDSDDRLQEEFNKSMEQKSTQEGTLESVAEWSSEMLEIVDNTIASVDQVARLKSLFPKSSDALTNPLSLNERIQGDVVNALPFRPDFSRSSRESSDYRSLVNGLRNISKQIVCLHNMLTKFSTNPSLKVLEAVLFDTSLFGRVIKSLLALDKLIVTSKSGSLFTLNVEELNVLLKSISDRIPSLATALSEDAESATIALIEFFGTLKSGYEVFKLDEDDMSANPFFSLFISELQSKSSLLYPDYVLPFTDTQYWQKGSLNKVFDDISPTIFKAVKDGAQKAITAYSVSTDLNKDLSVPMRVQALIAEYRTDARMIDSKCTTLLQVLNKNYGGDKNNPKYRSQRDAVIRNWKKKRDSHVILPLQLLLDPLLFCDDELMDKISIKLFGKTGLKGLNPTKKRKMMRSKSAEVSVKMRQACIDFISESLNGVVFNPDSSGKSKPRAKVLTDIDWSKCPIPTGVIAFAKNKLDRPQP